MFVQVIQGRLADGADEADLRAAMDRWMSDCRPGAIGWLGSTGGITDDGTFITVARFESPEAARRNSERPEQGAWWADTSKSFAGEVTFTDCPNVTTWLAGGSDEAGFVQVITGHYDDPEQMRDFMDAHSQDIKQMRPEIIGATVAVQDDGHYVQTVYFTSEAEARDHEAVEPPPDVAEMMSNSMKDAVFYDLHHPMMMSPR